ncbi:LysR family transcriptional regulator [Jejubacter calystegiae]|uniref:LysR family transcriptional regulator n=1 Tax=Jejubacter calystegiae TaxID=2579935 RepID=A0A4P8YD67_9ENTR|nr:LysR family transcriptional regulator [Jejubacter calystegiae]QCT18410.1 LysR family transcriptional regulator [Jejubacter calystegiae]
MDRLKAMAMFVTVAEQGSFSGAARALKASLTTISRSVAELETLLGAQLLIRTTRKLTLTDTGRDYLSAARKILAQVSEAEQAAAGEFATPRGELLITAPVMLGRKHLLPVVTAFLATWPEINIRLIFSDSNLDLIDQQVDMALRIGNLPDSSLVATRVGMMRNLTCASPELLDRLGEPRHPADLNAWPAIILNTGALPLTHWRFHEPDSGAMIDCRVLPRLSVTAAEAAVQAAEQGAGAARLLYYQVDDALARGSLREILSHYEAPPQPVQLVHASRGKMALKLRCFLDFAVPRLRERLSDQDKNSGR